MATKTPTQMESSAESKMYCSENGKYSCDKPERMSMTEVVKRIVEDPEFACFMRDLLYRSNGGDDKATECLQWFFSPTPADLETLGVQVIDMGASLRCTEQNRLLDAVANAYCIKPVLQEK